MYVKCVKCCIVFVEYYNMTEFECFNKNVMALQQSSVFYAHFQESSVTICLKPPTQWLILLPNEEPLNTYDKGNVHCTTFCIISDLLQVRTILPWKWAVKTVKC